MVDIARESEGPDAASLEGERWRERLPSSLSHINGFGRKVSDVIGKYMKPFQLTGTGYPDHFWVTPHSLSRALT